MKTVGSLLVLLSLVISCSNQSWQTKRIDEDSAYRYRPEHLNIDELRHKVEHRDGALPKSISDQTKVLVPSENKIYLFTESSHPAHPAVIILEPSESDAIPFSGHCGGDIDACEAWLLEVGETKSVLIGALSHGSWNDT